MSGQGKAKTFGHSLICPACGGPTSTIDSRPTIHADIDAVRRRRKCRACEHRFSTFEIEQGAFDGVLEKLTKADDLRRAIDAVKL